MARIQEVRSMDLPSDIGAAATSRSYVLAIVTLIWIVNLFDRNIFNAVLSDIKTEFELSDTALALMSGFGFTALYFLANFPLSNLADRFGRVPVIAIGLTCWSLMTIASGFVVSVPQLVLARSAVGVAEASSGGASQALLSDYFPPHKRGAAMAFLTLSTYIGIMLSFMVGSYIAQRFGWRASFIIAGIPGLFLALIFKMTIKDQMSPAPKGEQSITHAFSPIQSVRFLASQRSYVLILLALIAVQLCNAIQQVWSVPALIRIYGLNQNQAGQTFGPVIGLAGIVGSVAGIFLINTIAKKDMRWLVWSAAISFILSIPAELLFMASSRLAPALVGLGLTALLSSFAIAPAVTAIQQITKPRVRAFASAMGIALPNFLGLSLGPLAIGSLSDAMLSRQGHNTLRYALSPTLVFMAVAAVLFYFAAKTLRADASRVGEI